MHTVNSMLRYLQEPSIYANTNALKGFKTYLVERLQNAKDDSTTQLDFFDEGSRVFLAYLCKFTPRAAMFLAL